MRSYLTSRRLSPETDRELEPVATVFLQTVLLPSVGDTLAPRSQRELQTLAWALDEILRGRVLQAADGICQRMKAVESAHSVGTWSLAKFMELVSDQQVSCTGEDERAFVLRLRKAELRLGGAAPRETGPPQRRG